MASPGLDGPLEDREVVVPGVVDLDRQGRAEAIFGMVSYWFLASRARRYTGLRTHLVEILVRELTECLRQPRSESARLSAQVLLWDAWSHVLMHLEDTAALLQAVGEFGKQWEMHGKADPDLVYKHYISFGDQKAGSGGTPQAVLEQVGSSLPKARRALWLPSKNEWRKLYPGAPEEAYVPIPATAENLQRVARELLSCLRSESGAKSYESYLRFKHGMAMVALDLFHTRTAMQYPTGRVPDEATVRAEAEREVRRMRILMPRDPRTPRAEGPHLQSFDCNEEAAKHVLGSSQALSEIERYICQSVVHRAESEGTREFFVIRKAGTGEATMA